MALAPDTEGLVRQSRRLVEDTLLKRCLHASKPSQPVEQGSGVAAEAARTPAQPEAPVKEDPQF